MKLIWTETALADLDRIGGYISQDDQRAATRFVERLWKRAIVLKKHPRIGRIAPEIGNENIRELIEGNYRVIYRADPGAVYILTVFEGHRLFPSEVDHD